MGSPRYVVRKTAGRYVAVPRDGSSGIDRPTWVFGGLLVGFMGSRRRGLLGTAALVSGAAMIARGALGHNPLAPLTARAGRRAPGENADQTPSYQNDFVNRAEQLPADLVEEQSMESFPASDSPGRTGTTSGSH